MTSRAHLTLIVDNGRSCPGDSASGGQGSCAKVLDPYRLRVDLPEMWGDYVMGRFGSVERVAVFFGVAFQTACNWRDKIGRPAADKLLLAWLSDPEGFEAHFGQAGQKVAA